MGGVKGYSTTTTTTTTTNNMKMMNCGLVLSTQKLIREFPNDMFPFGLGLGCRV